MRLNLRWRVMLVALAFLFSTLGFGACSKKDEEPAKKPVPDRPLPNQKKKIVQDQEPADDAPEGNAEFSFEGDEDWGDAEEDAGTKKPAPAAGTRPAPAPRAAPAPSAPEADDETDAAVEEEPVYEEPADAGYEEPVEEPEPEVEEEAPLEEEPGYDDGYEEPEYNDGYQVE